MIFKCELYHKKRNIIIAMGIEFNILLNIFVDSLFIILLQYYCNLCLISRIAEKLYEKGEIIYHYL